MYSTIAAASAWFCEKDINPDRHCDRQVLTGLNKL